MVVNDGGETEGDIVLGHADLLWDLCNLDLDIDLNETLAEGVDANETRVDSLVELAELGDEADVALLDVLEGVGANDAARDGTESTNAAAEGVDWMKVLDLANCGNR